jgi:tRNA (guanine-N7-)-methyltransferase
MPSPSANRLPVTDPEYLYSDSKNPYREKNRQFEGRVFSDQDTENHKGQWLAKFPADTKRELHVEIGCNAGHVTLEWAASDPKGAYIGIDWKFKPIFWGIEKAVKRDIKNLVFLRAHAERLPFMFAPQEIDRLYLYFPDPWPKKKQLKNRFLTAQTLIRIAPLMKKGGIFHIKTDHAGYFEWMLEHVELANKEAASPVWEIVDKTHDLHKDHPNPTGMTIPEVTLFERLFIKDGIKINSMKLRAL